MITATHKEFKPRAPEKTYPWLGRYNNGHSDYIVLFNGPRSGVIVRVIKNVDYVPWLKVGHIPNSIAEDVFEPFYGDVILSQNLPLLTPSTPD